MTRASQTTTFFLLLAATTGCGRHAVEPESRPAESAMAVAAPPASAPEGVPPPAPAHLVWPDPAGWKRLPQSSAMRVATYQVPHEGGDKDDAELAIFHFGGGQGGAVEANLERWEKQFTDTKPADVRRSERTVNGLHAHLLEVDRGTYAAMMPGQASGPKPAYAMIAAVVETSLGSYFVKLTGPAKTVKTRHDGYYELLDGMRVEN